MLITEPPEFFDKLIGDCFAEKIKRENQIYLEFNEI